MHRPERLNGDRALRFTQLRCSSTAAPTTLVAPMFRSIFFAASTPSSCFSERSKVAFVSLCSRQYLVRESQLRCNAKIFVDQLERHPVFWLASSPAQILPCAREPDMSRNSTTQSMCGDRALTILAVIARLKHSCRLLLRVCLHIVIGGSSGFSECVSFRISFLFQRHDASCAELSLFCATRWRKLLRMSDDDSSDLRLRTGKIRDRGSSPSRRPRSFVAQVMKAVTKAKGAGIGPSPKRGDRSDRRRRQGSGSRLRNR